MLLRLGQKNLTKGKRSRSAPPVVQSPSKKVKVKRKLWTNKEMEEAFKAVASVESIQLPQIIMSHKQLELVEEFNIKPILVILDT